MQIGLHAGALSAWFTPHIQADARQHGAAPPTVEQVRERVLAWRQHISSGLQSAGHLTRDLSWDEESDEVEVATFAVDDLRCLKLLLAYDDGKGPAPAVLPERPELDERWVKLAEEGFTESGYPQLMVPELWLPMDFDFTFVCPLPDGHEVQAGSLSALNSECLALTELVFGGTPFEWALWTRSEDGALRASARRAVAHLGRVAREAADRQVPVLAIPITN